MSQAPEFLFPQHQTALSLVYTLKLRLLHTNHTSPRVSWLVSTRSVISRKSIKTGKQCANMNGPEREKGFKLGSSNPVIRNYEN